MNKDIIEKSLKARLDLFKIYIAIIIILVTGISGIALSYVYVDYTKLYLITIGILFLIFISFITVKSYIKIIALIKKLEE